MLNGTLDRETSDFTASSFVTAITDALNRTYGDPQNCLKNRVSSQMAHLESLVNFKKLPLYCCIIVYIFIVIFVSWVTDAILICICTSYICFLSNRFFNSISVGQKI